MKSAKLARALAGKAPIIHLPERSGVLWACDIECEDWEHFVLGCAASETGEAHHFRTLRQMADWYVGLDPRDVVIAHNGGRYDFLALLSVLWREGPKWTGTLAGSALVSLRARGHAELRDSYRLVMQSLRDWTGAKEALGLPCLCGEDCGGYCSIHRKMAARVRERVAEYCLQDCRALITAYKSTVARAEADGFAIRDARGKVRRTCGGVAWATAQALCPELAGDGPPEDWSELDTLMLAAFGGRVEGGATHADRVEQDDVNSMYPWCLTQPVPTGKASILHDARAARRAFARGRPGIYTARVSQRAEQFALLPHRGPEGDMLWATGEVEGSWSHLELEAAARHGATVRVQSGIVYAREKAIYAPFMRRMWELRDDARARGDESYREFVKRIANSFTGKTGQEADSETLHILDERNDTPREDWRYCGGTGPLSVFVSTHRRIPDCSRPHHYCTLTARSRVKLLEERLLPAGERFVYCDTDGAKYRGKRIRTNSGDGLGEWKYEGALAPWRCRGLKLYAGMDADGEWAVKAKGIPNAALSTFQALCAGLTVAREAGVEGVRTAFKVPGRPFRKRRVERGVRRSPDLLGTRYVCDPQHTVSLHREADGSYRWPGVDVEPAMLLDVV